MKRRIILLHCFVGKIHPSKEHYIAVFLGPAWCDSHLLDFSTIRKADIFPPRWILVVKHLSRRTLTDSHDLKVIDPLAINSHPVWLQIIPICRGFQNSHVQVTYACSNAGGQHLSKHMWVLKASAYRNDFTTNCINENYRHMCTEVSNGDTLLQKFNLLLWFLFIYDARTNT